MKTGVCVPKAFKNVHHKICRISLCEHMMDITICSVEHLRGTVGPCFDSKIFREIIPPHAALLARARARARMLGAGMHLGSLNVLRDLF